MTIMLAELGLYSIMQVTKCCHWPCDMPTNNIVANVGNLYGAHFTMNKTTRSGRIFDCAYHDYKIKAVISSCSTTRLTGRRTLVGDKGEVITIQQPEVVEEYETHKNNLTSYHDVISTERWEMRFYGFILGICKANAYSSYCTFSYQKFGVSHFSFRDILAYNFLQYCKNLAGSDIKGP
ncbi:hypothetical protein K493DRAFT_303558 [Basidiobolus meristosporus CBS 931.73]|uniref:PiggyBac transposable element-derived protein domain-containing protein n=1 Tax=Basidiobolus meristosporus CBS 931.73 TaxID=1314790 RepID=A0A1Y1Y2D6_9FUNG|nr:hypothetical protein K493DRAFT_303558 [Basidiobolus meristosporus CBS 931.73]|eukprot:ORX92148.1 hypothetical protein K493DRAFT_303558 [Basidiobolus meristosporus CBS 931.73]